MICTNCGSAVADGASFCTNCGTPVGIGAAGVAKDPSEIGASLEAAVQANNAAMDSIEARAQAQVDEAFKDFEPYQPPAESSGDAQPGAQPPAPDGYQPPSYGYGTPAASAGHVGGAGAAPGAAVAGAGAAFAASGAGAAQPGAPDPVPGYQQAAGPNAHYSSQRSYEGNAYGQGSAQQPYQQPTYGQPAQQQAWPVQTATNRAFAMTIYAANLLGVIFALCVRDKDNEFITHHLNNAVVILIGSVLACFLSIVLIGFLLGLYLFVMWIMGIVSAYNGDMKELPLIGKIHIIK